MAHVFSAVQLFFLLALFIIIFGSYIVMFYFVIELSMTILNIFVKLNIFDEFDLYYSSYTLPIQLLLITVIAAIIIPSWTCFLYWIADVSGLLTYFA